jgi:uncharacterized protein with HEPN domain
MENLVLSSLYNILEGITTIQEILQGIGFTDYRNDRKRKIAVVQVFEGIFLEMRNLPDSFDNEEWQLFRQQFEALHLQFIGDGMGLDDDLVWDTAKHRMKKLSIFIKGFIEPLKSK